MYPSTFGVIEKAALERLIGHAQRDSGQSRHCADFLLAWWNAEKCGGFDLTDGWPCDEQIVEDMVTVMSFVLRSANGSYPDKLGYGPVFEQLVHDWRPDLVK